MVTSIAQNNCAVHYMWGLRPIPTDHLPRTPAGCAPGLRPPPHICPTNRPSLLWIVYTRGSSPVCRHVTVVAHHVSCRRQRTPTPVANDNVCQSSHMPEANRKWNFFVSFMLGAAAEHRSSHYYHVLPGWLASPCLSPVLRSNSRNQSW